MVKRTLRSSYHITGMPTNQGERKLMLDRQSSFLSSRMKKVLQQAQLPLVTLVGGEQSLQGDHWLLLARSQNRTTILPLLPPV